MDELESFASYINSLSCNPEELSTEEARSYIIAINNFLYCNYEGIGKDGALDSKYDYISDLHKYWTAVKKCYT